MGAYRLISTTGCFAHNIISISFYLISIHTWTQVAIELLAAVTVQKVMKVAREPSGLSEKSSSELNFSSATSSRARQDTGTITEATEQTEWDGDVG